MLPTRKSVPRSSRQSNHTDHLTIVKRCKLQWYGHVSRSSGLAKTILQGTVKGGRRQGRQRKRWEDNIREWTGLELAKSQRAVENREKWRKLVVKSSVVPQQPLRLGIDDDVESEKKPTNAHLDFKMNDLIENFLSEFRLMLSLLHQLYQG